MSDLLSIGVSGLLAYRKALDTAGHNIANVDTEGYSRQRVELSSRAGEPRGDGIVGAGVTSDTVRRLADALVATRLQGDTSAYARAETYAGLAARVDGWLSDVDTGLSRPLQGFYDALGNLGANPASTASRQALLGAAGSLAERFSDLQGQFDSLEAELNQRLTQTADEVTRYAQAVAQLNERIVVATGQAGGQPPNDLLDQRDQLIQQIAQRIGITTTTDAGGINIFTGSGQALVLGRQANALTVGEDAYRSGRLELMFAGGQNITAQTSGGSIGGLLDFRREVLDPARNELGLLAAGIAAAMNAQHAAGLDARGQMGGDFFVPLSGSATGAIANTGSAALAVQIADAGALTGDALQLSYNGSVWQLTRVRDGSSVSFTGSGSSADPLRTEGIAIVVGSGTPAAGDRFLIQPTAEAAGQLRVAITDPARIAAAAPVRASSALANRGSGAVQGLTATDASNASLRSAVTIQFIGANSYSINGSGSYAYSAGSPISVNGWSLTLGGAPAAGDRFEVGANTAASNDNGNARLLADLANRAILHGGRDTLSGAQASLIARVGSQAQQAGMQEMALATVRDQTAAQQQSLSGVNLDEEAADLVRFQQAYQAAARVIAVANDVFQSLLDAARG